MRRCIFQLQFVTPALIAGACPKTVGQVRASAELREASIRGQLRWWHRFLGFNRGAEERIYGSAAGNSGHASGTMVRILDTPRPVVAPQSASDFGLHPNGGIVEYLAFNLRGDENARSALPEGTSFHVMLQTTRLSDEDWATLTHTMEVFSWLGALGTRSRRCFGSLTLLAKDGKTCRRPGDWSSVLRSKMVETRRVPDVEDREWRGLFRKAGGWLREARQNARDKERLFGTAGTRRRIASAILLRPDWSDDRFGLLAIGRRSDLDQVPGLRAET